MKNVLYLSLCLILLFSCSKQQDVTKSPRSDWFYQQRAYPHQKINYKSLIRASEEMRTTPRRSSIDEPWEFEGPINVGGRITDIEMFSDDQQTILAGSASGGIFRSPDLGQTWEPIFDDAISLSIGDIEISKSDENIIYVGTGEANAGGGSIAYDGLGVYKSADKGNSWQHIGLEEVGSIGKVVVDPENSDVVYVAAMGRLFGNNPERGIYRTQDGGDNWENILNVSDSTGGIDIVIDPQNSSVLYAAMWERTRRPNDLIYGGASSGIYKSTNGGDDWVELGGGLPTAPALKGRIGIAISASNPSVLYAYYARTNGSLQGVYRTDDKGDNWERKSNGTINNVPFIWWFGKIFVNPENEDDVYVCSLEMHRSSNGGDNWNEIFDGVHVDQHSLFIHPQNPSLQILGNDGGVHISNNFGSDWEKSNSLPNIQFYTCHISELNPDYLLGGTQDNGTNRTLTPSIDGWEQIFDGDGFDVFVDPTNEDVVYASSQNGFLGRSLNGGISFASITNGLSGTTNWKSPYLIDPNNNERLYFGTNRLFRSENRGNTWQAVSPDLSNGPYSGNRSFGTVTAIHVSSINENHIAAGTDDGNIWISSDFGDNWTLASEDLPSRWVTSLAWDGFEENSLTITLSGFRFDENEGHIYRTTNLGSSWTDISTNLPDIPYNDIISDRVEPDKLYLASDIGVFLSEDNGNSWNPLGIDLPLVPVTDIYFHHSARKLVAATYGRSMYSYQFEEPVFTNELQSKANIRLYPNPISSNGELNIEGMELDQYDQIRLLSIEGKIIKQWNTAQSTITLDKNIPTGSYIIHIMKGGTLIHNEKIIVQ